MIAKKQYVLGMFPYPSGEGLHVGHVRIYTACDVMARYFKMKGYEVMSPMGWDAFGLPAENAAIKSKMNPQDVVPRNYNNFRSQMQHMSFDFDWSREFATTDPTYYGLTQWIFLQLYSKGLVYREQVPINWCPKCKTGLANEEVLGDGTHERCGTVTGKKLLPQWVMKITSYAEELLKDLGEKGGKDELNWPNGILEMQRNWIGKKEGTTVKFGIMGNELRITSMEVFTTRVDTIDGVTFVVIAPETVTQWMKHGWVPSKEVVEYSENAISKSQQSRLEGEKDKTGIKTDLLAVNPITHEEVPIYVADYVLAEVGTGCVMGVPQYDERDQEFATKHDLPIKNLPLLDYKQTLQKLVDMGMAKKETTYHLRDWVFSRQRYWGEPIPLVYCEKCGDENGVVMLTEKDLPLELPYLESYEPTDTGESPLSRVTEWVACKCPKCGGKARRETDTMPNWAGSCWYFLAYPFWKNAGGPSGSDLEGQDGSAPQGLTLSTKTVLQSYKSKSQTPYTDFWKEVATPEIERWLPADWYLGGAEHAVLHLLYARFWVKVLHDLKLLSFPEPFLRLRSVGMVLAEDGRKMSKSWGNVINPDDVVQQFGSDAVRLYEMFMGPWDQAIAWDTRSLVGQQRFLERTLVTAKMEWKIVKAGGETSPQLAKQLAKLLSQVERGILEQKFNTSIAGMMEFVNAWRPQGQTLRAEDLSIFARIMSPFAPKAAQELWQAAGMEGDPAKAEWPTMSADLLAISQDLPITIAVQVNGKLRGTVSVLQSESTIEDRVVEKAIVVESVAKWIPPASSGQVFKKVIFVPGKIVNIVL